MLPNETDEEIILLYKNGDEQAFKTLIERYAALLYNFTARLGNRNDAPDMVQEILLKVWKNIGHFDPSRASFKTWIFIIARNTVTDFLRKKKSLLFSDLEKDDEENADSFGENIPAEDLLPDAILQRLENTELLNKTLEKLRFDYREVLVLHYQEEMTFEEIGKILNKPANTVKSQHRRALMKLKKILK